MLIKTLGISLYLITSLKNQFNIQFYHNIQNSAIVAHFCHFRQRRLLIRSLGYRQLCYTSDKEIFCFISHISEPYFVSNIRAVTSIVGLIAKINKINYNFIAAALFMHQSSKLWRYGETKTGQKVE